MRDFERNLSTSIENKTAMTTSLTPQKIRANRLKLIMLWMVPFGLMVIAAIVYGLVQAGYISVGSKNNGELIQPPVHLDKLALTTILPANYTEENLWAHKWTLVVRGGAKCDESCRDSLYIARQIHVRLDKAANRAQRLYLSDTPVDQDLLAYFEKEHRYLRVAIVDPKQLELLDKALESIGDDAKPARFFVVDPEAWAMMAYHDGHDGGLILKDLKHLLKYSRER